MDDSVVFCDWEGERFPRDQFDSDPDYGLVHSRRPDESSPRHTATGDALDDDDDGDGGGGGGGGGGSGGGGGGKYDKVYQGIAYAPRF